MLKHLERQVNSPHYPIDHWDSHDLNDEHYDVDFEFDHHDINREKHFLNSRRTSDEHLFYFNQSMHKLLADVEPLNVVVHLLPTFGHYALNQPRSDYC